LLPALLRHVQRPDRRLVWARARLRLRRADHRPSLRISIRSYRMRFQDSEPDRRSHRPDFADRGYRPLLACHCDCLSPRQYRAAARTYGDGNDVAGEQESSGYARWLARGDRSLQAANSGWCRVEIQLTASFRQAARKKATRLATCASISARSVSNFSPNNARMIIGLKTK